MWGRFALLVNHMWGRPDWCSRHPLSRRATQPGPLCSRGRCATRERPFGGMAVGASLLRARLFAMCPLRSLSDAREVFQADQSVGVRVQDVLADGVVGIQLQPSLCPAQRDSAARGAASAFSLKSFLESGVVIRLALVLPFRYRPSTLVQGSHRGEITLPDIDANHAGRRSGRGSGVSMVSETVPPEALSPDPTRVSPHRCWPPGATRQHALRSPDRAHGDGQRA